MIVRDVELRDPRPGDVVVTPATGAYGHAMANNYNGVPAAAGRLLRDGEARVVVRRETYEDLVARDAETVPRRPARPRHRRRGVRRAAARERADAIEPITGLRPEIAGVLTRSRGDFEEILEGSDLVVELMGGLEPARDYVLRAMRAGKHVVTANKQLLCHARRGAVGDGARARRAAALRGGRRRRRAGHPRAAGVAGRPRTSSACTGSSTGRRTTSSPRWPRTGASYADGAGRGAAARLRRGRPDRRRQRHGRRGEDGDPRAAGVRHAGAPRPGPLRGHRAHHRRRHGVRARARPRAQADRDRRARRRRASACACTRRSSTPATRWPPSTGRSTR